jgi:hypothetical protein
MAHLQKSASTGRLLKMGEGHLVKTCVVDPCDETTGCISANDCGHCDTDCTPECFTVAITPVDAMCGTCCGNVTISGSFAPSYTLDQVGGSPCAYRYEDLADTDLEYYTHAGSCGAATLAADQKLVITLGFTAANIVTFGLTKGSFAFTFPAKLKTSEICAVEVFQLSTSTGGCAPASPCNVSQQMTMTATPCCEEDI